MPLSPKPNEKGGRPALGRGLSALIPTDSGLPAEGPNSVQEVLIAEIRVNPLQPRTRFDSEAIEELAESIRQKGVIQPVLVRPTSGGYELVAGERRLRASKLAGLLRIPVVVREMEDQESLEIALIENIQRQDLSPIESAKAYATLMERFGHSQSDLARHLGKNRTSVSNTLRLLSLPPHIQNLVHDGSISFGHAKALLSLPAGSNLERVARTIVDNSVSVRDVEKMRQEPSPPRTKADDPNVNQLEEDLQRALGTRVQLKYRKGKGKLEICFFSDDDLERLLSLLGVGSGPT